MPKKKIFEFFVIFIIFILVFENMNEGVDLAANATKLDDFLDFHFHKFKDFLDGERLPADETVRRNFLRLLLAESFGVEPGKSEIFILKVLGL